jgi:hypothetical protein
MNETTEMNQIDQIDQRDETDKIATSRGKVGIMPQDMATNPYNQKYLLLKMPYRFITGYQLHTPSSAWVQCDCSLLLDFRRSRP